MNKLYLYDNYPELCAVKGEIEKAIDLLVECYRQDGKVLVCGNGGSSADASHIVGELMKNFHKKRKLKMNGYDGCLEEGIPAIDLTAQAGIMTAFSNDTDASYVYAQQVYAYGSHSKKDVVIGISTSGNSQNVVNAIQVAKKLGLKSIALTGKKDSKLSTMATVTIKVPAEDTFRVQEYHLPIYHYICMMVEDRLFEG